MKLSLVSVAVVVLVACAADNSDSAPTKKCPCMPGDTYTCHCPEDGDDPKVQTGSLFCTKQQLLTQCVCAADRYQEPVEE
jgi:hypothetical protein